MVPDSSKQDDFQAILKGSKLEQYTSIHFNFFFLYNN